ncbi:uracil-DNA glycosylase [Methylovorus sp. MM2]|uniref:uracil-DNA glycosylase n=1 Tax=Methylovorus sp. MM2 TaxID=1848038 RepID=UPI0007E09907|nr:uracil-DNA glycosylase [Methylovorus sp. MM2]OAM52082.1 uracil-DNA glycosylase [Methylovorus sp. MM2]
MSILNKPQETTTPLEELPSAWATTIPHLPSLYTQISDMLANEQDIRPRRGLWFEALRKVLPSQVNVVLIGQDPYHGEDKGIQQAHGLSFSVPDGVRPPPSLKNILKELESDLGRESKVSSGNLSRWSEQGVLLLNAALTTKGGIAGAHRKYWQRFTQALMQYLGARPDSIIFILWGGDAQKYKALIAAHHIVIESVHPSPLSVYRGFFGSKPFSQANAALSRLHKPAIDW